MSEFNPDVSEATQVSARSFADDPAIELHNEDVTNDDDDLVPRPAAPKGVRDREGLPASYRMRADEHYVEELMSRRETSDGDADGAVPPPPVADDERRQRILTEIAGELESIEQAAALLNEHGSALSRRVGIDLIRAQAARAAWMLRAQAISSGAHLHNVRPVTVGNLLTGIRDGLAAECRLSGISLQMQAADLQSTVSVDEDAVSAAVTAAVITSIALIGSQEGAVIRVTAVALGGDLRTIEVRQDAAAVGPTARRRFFDGGWTDRPGGWVAALAAETVKQTAQMLGGDATFLVRDRRGCTIRLTFSRAS